MKAFSGFRIDGFSKHHIQGIAIDARREYMYLSFTKSLIKTDLEGNIIGSVKGIMGHLGCLAYNKEDGMVYASLEYNDDAIGMGILKNLEKKIDLPNRFYIAVFDVEKITRPDMDAEKDGIMTAVFLKEVSDDYAYPDHKYGCSGIDGVTFAPLPGELTGNYLYVAYGIYSDKKRNDNDHQILLRYDMSEFSSYEQQLRQDELHLSGPDAPHGKYYVYTGNTTYGIQNLEYSKENKCLFAAVYKGKKLRFPNYLMYAINIEENGKIKKLKGLSETGETLSLKRLPFFKRRGSISGCNFPYGSTGMISLGNGSFIFSQEFKDNNGHGTDICTYSLNEAKGFIREEILL